MTAPDRTPERVVEEAQKLLGVGENPPGSNCNWIIQRWGLCTQWCDATVFTTWFNAGFNDFGAFHMEGVATDYKLGDLYVPNTMRHFQAAGRFSQTPVPGAAEIHFWGGPESNSHVAIYIKDYGDGTHLNIEGNHNNLCEYVRRPNVDSTRKGYCIPAYITAPVPTPVPEEDDDMIRLFTHKGGIFIGVIPAWYKHIDTPGVVQYAERSGVKWNDTDSSREVQDDVFDNMVDLGKLATK